MNNTLTQYLDNSQNTQITRAAHFVIDRTTTYHKDGTVSTLHPLIDYITSEHLANSERTKKWENLEKRIKGWARYELNGVVWYNDVIIFTFIGTHDEIQKYGEELAQKYNAHINWDEYRAYKNIIVTAKEIEEYKQKQKEKKKMKELQQTRTQTQEERDNKLHDLQAQTLETSQKLLEDTRANDLYAQAYDYIRNGNRETYKIKEYCDECGFTNENIKNAINAANKYIEINTKKSKLYSEEERTEINKQMAYDKIIYDTLSEKLEERKQEEKNNSNDSNGGNAQESESDADKLTKTRAEYMETLEKIRVASMYEKEDSEETKALKNKLPEIEKRLNALGDDEERKGLKKYGFAVCVNNGYDQEYYIGQTYAKNEDDANAKATRYTLETTGIDENDESNEWHLITIIKDDYKEIKEFCTPERVEGLTKTIMTSLAGEILFDAYGREPIIKIIECETLKGGE